MCIDFLNDELSNYKMKAKEYSYIYNNCIGICNNNKSFFNKIKNCISKEKLKFNNKNNKHVQVNEEKLVDAKNENKSLVICICSILIVIFIFIIDFIRDSILLNYFKRLKSEKIKFENMWLAIKNREINNIKESINNNWNNIEANIKYTKSHTLEEIQNKIKNDEKKYIKIKLNKLNKEKNTEWKKIENNIWVEYWKSLFADKKAKKILDKQIKEQKLQEKLRKRKEEEKKELELINKIKQYYLNEKKIELEEKYYSLKTTIKDNYEIKIKEELDCFEKYITRNVSKYKRLWAEKIKNEEAERKREEQRREYEERERQKEVKRKREAAEKEYYAKKRKNIENIIITEPITMYPHKYYSNFSTTYIVKNIKLIKIQRTAIKDPFLCYKLYINDAEQLIENLFYKDSSKYEFERYVEYLFKTCESVYNERQKSKNKYKSQEDSYKKSNNKYDKSSNNCSNNMTFSLACEILSIKESGNFEYIKSRYRALALRWHPDKNNNSIESIEKMKKINLAFEYLKNYYENKR